MEFREDFKMDSRVHSKMDSRVHSKMDSREDFNMDSRGRIFEIRGSAIRGVQSRGKS